MKYASILCILLLTAACSSTSNSMTSSSTAPLDVKVEQTTTNPDLYYFAGPINIQYALTVTNPTNDTYKLRRLNLQTVGPGAYTLRTGDSPMNYTIPPGTTTIQLSAWGRGAGGFMRATEPVSIRGMAYFDGPHGSFVRAFTQYIPQQ
jgi:hypothetical protein